MSDLAAAPAAISRDLQMGLGIIPKDQDFIDRTAATIARNGDPDHASRYAAGQTDNGFEDNYNAGTTASATSTSEPQTDYTGSGTFGDAFAAARDNLGPGQTFTYDGASYSTAITGEDPALDAAMAANAAGAGAVETSLRPQARPEPEVDPSTLPEFGPYIDADTLDPRGNQIESPTGTGIGQPSTSTTNVSQDILDQIGGVAGTTIEDLLPSNATTAVGLDNMNFQDRFDLQTFEASMDPSGQSTATGVLTSPSEYDGDILPGTAIDRFVVDDSITGRPATYQVVTGPDGLGGTQSSTQLLGYYDVSTGTPYATIAEARLAGVEDGNLVLDDITQTQNIPTESSYVVPGGGPEQLIKAGGSPVGGPMLINPFNLGSTIKDGLSTAYDTITGAISNFDDRNKSADQIALGNQAAYEREAFGPFGRDPETGQATAYETLPDGTMIRQGLNPYEGLGIVGVGLNDLSELGSSAAKSVGNFFAKPTITEREGQLPLIGAESNFLTEFGQRGMDQAKILGDRAFDALSPEAQANLTNPVFPEGGGVDFGALGSKVVRTLPSAGAAIAAPPLAGYLTVGDVGMSSDAAIDSAVADGTLADLSQADVQTLKDEARRTNTIPAALVGTITNLLPGRLGQNLLQRMGISGAEEYGQEALLEPNLAQNTANLAMGTGPEFLFEPEAGTVAAIASGGTSVATSGRGPASNQAGGAGPNVDTTGPVQPAAPAASVLSGQALATPTQVDVAPTIQQPVQPVAPSASQSPNLINIPGTDVVVQSVAPAQPQAPNQGPPSGIESLGTGGAFQQPNVGNVPSQPAPSNVDAQPTVDQTQAPPPEVDTQAPSLDMSQTNVSIGNTIGGLTVADSQGLNLSNQDAQLNLDPRRTMPGSFTNMQGEKIGGIGNAKLGEPVGRLIENKDGSSTIQVSSRMSGGSTGARDNYNTVAVTVPPNATDAQIDQANREAVSQWKSNYEGVTSSDQIQSNTGQVSLPQVDTAPPSAPQVDTTSPESLTASEILQNEIDIITTDTNTTADQASQEPASIALIEAAQNEGANVNVGDSRADVSSKIVNQVALDNQAAAEEAMGLTLPDIDVATINQPSVLPQGVGSLDAAVDSIRQTLSPQGIANLEVAQTGGLSLKTARELAEANDLSMMDASNLGERPMNLPLSREATDAEFFKSLPLASTANENQLAAEEAMGRDTTEFVFDGEVLSPTDVTTEVETPVDTSQTIEGTVASQDVATVVDVPVDTSTTIPTDTTTRASTTTTVPETIRAVRSTDTAPRDEDEVEVEVDEPATVTDVTTGDPEDDVEVEIDPPVTVDTDDDDDDDDTAEDAPFECPDGFEAVQIDGVWRCQKIGDEDTPKIGRMRPTGGSYYQPRRPSPVTTAKAYRFR